MEAYSPTTSATNAVLTFLEAWTSTLHGLGYQSGVYSSSGSGIVDLAAQVGTGYALPDDLWIANWNNQENTLDPVVPRPPGPTTSASTSSAAAMMTPTAG